LWIFFHMIYLWEFVCWGSGIGVAAYWRVYCAGRRERRDGSLGEQALSFSVVTTKVTELFANCAAEIGVAIKRTSFVFWVVTSQVLIAIKRILYKRLSTRAHFCTHFHQAPLHTIWSQWEKIWAWERRKFPYPLWTRNQVQLKWDKLQVEDYRKFKCKV